jgi:branched-chain amino acid transport system permease protein
LNVFIDTILTGLIIGSIYSLIALGLVLAVKATNVFNLAHGGFIVLGGYLGYELMISSGLPLWLGAILTLMLGMIFGLLLDRGVMRPLIGQSPITLFMATLVLASFIDALVILIWGAQDRYLAIIPLKTVSIFGFAYAQALLYSSGVALLLFFLLVLLFRYTKIGLGMRCVAEDVRVSQSLGINVKRIFTICWMICCVVAVSSGILYGIAYSVNPTISSFGLSKGFPVILLGGVKSIPGAFLGGLLLGVIEMLLGQYAEPAIHYELRTVASMAIMLLVLLVRPTGIFGVKEIERI